MSEAAFETVLQRGSSIEANLSGQLCAAYASRDSWRARAERAEQELRCVVDTIEAYAPGEFKGDWKTMTYPVNGLVVQVMAALRLARDKTAQAEAFTDRVRQCGIESYQELVAECHAAIPASVAKGATITDRIAALAKMANGKRKP